MNKRDLVARIAVDAELTKAQAARALDAFVEAVQSSLQKGDRVTLVGFGTFGVFERKAKQVKEPRGGRPMIIAARRVPRFAPGLELKDAVATTAEPVST
jgi:DNA-binding protein HU-beta